MSYLLGKKTQEWGRQLLSSATRWIRHFVFYLGITVWTAAWAVVFLGGLILPRRIIQKGSVIWTQGCLKWAQWILGIYVRIRGQEHLPLPPYILACKHQSAWETLALNHIVPHYPTFVMKDSLFKVPVSGWILKKAGMIGVRRGAIARSPNLANSFFHQAKKYGPLESRPIVIFPEGTRGAPGADTTYKRGVFLLAQELDLPVVPAALNSGVFWPRRGFFKHPGTIDLVFLPELPAPSHQKTPYSQQDFMNQLSQSIETACQKLPQPKE